MSHIEIIPINTGNFISPAPFNAGIVMMFTERPISKIIHIGNSEYIRDKISFSSVNKGIINVFAKYKNKIKHSETQVPNV